MTVTFFVFSKLCFIIYALLIVLKKIIERLPAVATSLAKSTNGIKQAIIRKGNMPKNFRVDGFPGIKASTPYKDG